MDWRDSIYLDDGRGPAGDVSERYWETIDYGNVLEAVATALDNHPQIPDDQVSGRATVSPTGHKFSAYIDVDDPENPSVVVGDDDPISLGLKIRTGHTGQHGLHYTIAGERQICSNGMTIPTAELSLSQTHKKPLDYGLAQQAVDALVTAPEIVEDRLEAAQQQTFVNEDEALLTLYDIGMDQYLDDPYDTLRESLDAELPEDTDQPSLYTTYNAATRALTHEEDLPQHAIDGGLQRAGQLLDQHGELPDASALGYDATEHRIHQYIDDEADPYWENEEEALETIMQHHHGSHER